MVWLVLWRWRWSAKTGVRTHVKAMEVDEVVATVASLVTCHIKVTRQPVPGGTGLSWVQELVPVPVPVTKPVPFTSCVFGLFRSNTLHQDKGTALKIWEALQGDFQNKSQMVAVDLRQRLQQERCAEKGDVRAHFSKLRTMREDLAAMGHPPGDDEFYAIILGSLPYSFEPFISTLNATLSVLGTVLSPDELMQALTDEYDHRTLSKSSKKEEENAAFSIEEGNGRKGNGQKKGNCYNCGKPGHRKDDCWKEGGGKEGQKPNWLKEREKWQKERREDSHSDKPKAKESAKHAEVEEDVAWMAYISDPEDNDNVVSTILSDEGSMDWWDELVEGEKEDFDKQVDKAGNQPIPQSSKPEELPLAQPKEEG